MNGSLNLQAATDYANLAMKLNNIARQMTLNGISTSKTAIETHFKRTYEEIQQARKKFNDIAGGDYGITEVDDDGNELEGEADLDKRERLSDLFFTKWGVQAKYFSKKTGRPSLNKNCLHDLLAEGEEKPKLAAREILKYRAADKTRQFLVKLEPVIHTTWNVCATETSRWSESPFGIQRIKKPDTDRDGKVTKPGLKDCFIVDSPELWLVSADKSQLEMRINAVFAGDQPLLDLFKAGGSVHRQNAKDLFGTDDDTAYNVAKTFAYAVAYDAVAETVWRQLVLKFPEITLRFVKATMAKWFKLHPALVEYKQEQLDFVRRKCYSWLPLSNRRYYYYLGSARPSEIINQRIQTTASDDMNPATLRVAESLAPNEQLKAQVHDELLCQGPDWQKLAQKMKSQMDSVLTYWGREVNLSVEVKYGKSWGQMEKVKW